jgi:glycerol-3-phosphate dehydrogenase
MSSTPDRSTSAPELSARTRQSNLLRMNLECFDVVVIGGGITGAGAALDAATRGLRVALVEKSDFASGTSSRSSKLIHGGLRYLEQMEFGLVYESLHERAVLSRIAPHLSKRLQFLIPVYSSAARSPLGTNRLKLSAGLWLYDFLAGRRNVGRHRWLSRETALTLAPALEPNGLRGAFCYYDCLTDDSRLVIEIIKSAAAHGAVVANYLSVCGLSRDKDGLTIIKLENLLGGDELELRASVTINAAGVWSDEISRLSGTNSLPRLRPSKGIHVVIPSVKLKNSTAVLIPSFGENRFLFVIPWHGFTVIGTTDSDYSGDLNNPRAESAEIDRVIKSAAAAFPEAKLSVSDVISTFAGLRPLIGGNEESTRELSRREAIFEEDFGLITITGGKLTTWRRMAEQVIDIAVRKLHAAGSLSHRPDSVTEMVQLAGGAVTGDPKKEASIASSDFGIELSTALHLIDTYAGNYRQILQLTRESPELKRRLIEGLPHISAEVFYAARHEMAITVGDILSRRTRIELLSPDQGQACEERVRDLLELEVGKRETLARKSDRELKPT